MGGGRGLGITSISRAVNGSLRLTSASGRVVPLRSAVKWNAGDISHNGIKNVSLIIYLFLNFFPVGYISTATLSLLYCRFLENVAFILAVYHTWVRTPLMVEWVNILDVHWVSRMLLQAAT